MFSGEGGLSLAWYSMDGIVELLPFESNAFDDPTLASDGNRIAVSVNADLDAAIWIYELDRQLGQRLTPPGLLADSPVWSPDGEWVYFRDQAQGIVARIRADFTGAIEPVAEGSIEGIPHDISADGSLIGVNLPGTTSIGIFELPGGEPKVIVQSDAVTLFPNFSPGGDQVAYSSQESGTLQTYVRELESGRRHLVSPSLGLRPMWGPDGKTLYYVGGQGQNRLFKVSTLFKVLRRLMIPCVSNVLAGHILKRRRLSMQIDHAHRRQFCLSGRSNIGSWFGMPFRWFSPRSVF